MVARVAYLRLFAIVILMGGLIALLGGRTVEAAALQQFADLPPAGTVVPATTLGEYRVFLPLVERHEWVEVPLINSGFEDAWDTESSHRALVVNTDNDTITEKVFGNIFTPPGWVTWFRQGEADSEEGIQYGQPEVRSAAHTSPDRMRSGAQGQLLFTFWRIHDAGFLQYVDVTPGAQVRVSGWAHAWSNNGDAPTAGNPDDPYWSDGSHVGYDHLAALEGTEGLDSSDQNFTFQLGIDPTGGNDPFADTVVWGSGMHIYNAYAEVPSVSATAEGSAVTIFLRSRTLWRFKHNDAYWDDITLEVVR